MTDRCEECICPPGKKCPLWVGHDWGVFEGNVATGEQRLVTGCFPKVMLRLMEFVIRSNNSAAAAIESSRNVVASGFAAVSQAIDMARASDAQLIVEPSPTLLQHRKTEDAE